MAKQPFSQSFLDEIRKGLEAEKEKLERDLGKTSHKGADGENDPNFPDFGKEVDDDVQEVEQFTVNKPLTMSLEKSLRDVNKALKRLDEGSYGICKYCDKAIDENRLRARPTSGACVDCKKLLTSEA